MDMFWDDDAIPLDTGRDQRIADGLEVAALDDSDDGSFSEASNGDIGYYNPQTKESAPARNKRRKLRVPGGIAPTAKPVTANYDSDDGRIIELKQLAHSDEFISAKLIEEGRIRYVPKTIGSRYQRLRKVIDDKEDEKLDDELSDWHEGEDEKLLPIVQTMEAKLARQIERLRARMWRDVSGYLAGQLGGRKKYTHNACRERAEAIAAGTELMAIEQDPDQDGRRKMREERIKAAKAARAAAANEAIELEARKKLKTMEKKRAIAEANQKRVAFQLKKNAEKKERLRIREERNANRELSKNSRLRILNHMRIERDWTMEKNRREKQIYKKIMGVDLNGKPPNRPGHKSKTASDSDEESEAIDDLESDEEEMLLTDAEEADDADDESDIGHDPGLEDPYISEEANIIGSVIHSPAPGRAALELSRSDEPQRKRKSTVATSPAEDTVPIPTPVSKRKLKPTKVKVSLHGAELSSVSNTVKSSPSKKKSPPKPAPIKDGSNAVVTEETMFNPRTVMARNELDLICFARGIDRLSATKESHPQLVARLNAIDEALSRQELDDLLRLATEGTHGNRLAKIERLQKFDASKSIAGGMGLDSHDLDHMRQYEGFRGEFKYLLDDAEHTAARQHQPGSRATSTEPVIAFTEW